MLPSTFDKQKLFDQLSSIYNEHLTKNFLILGVRALLIFALIIFISSGVVEVFNLATIVLAFVCALVSMFFQPNKPKKINRNQMDRFSLGEAFEKIDFEKNQNTDINSQMQYQPLSKYKAAHRSYTKTLATRLIPLAVCLLAIMIFLPRSFTNMKSSWVSYKNWKNRGIEMTIKSGLGEASEEIKINHPIKLQSGKLKTVKLIEENLIELKIDGWGSNEDLPVVELLKGDEVYQTFLSTSTSENSAIVKFAVGQSSSMRIVSFSKNKLVDFEVKKLPVPEVELKLITKIKEPWPDEKPINFRIKIDAENPLSIIQFLIVSSGKASQELVKRVMVDDLHKFDDTYELTLEPYVQTDIATVEVMVQAIDKGLPQPLVGMSEPIKINTASAYGRYQRTLAALRDFKSLIDKELAEGEKQHLNEDAMKTLKTVVERANNTPFFDGYDRQEIKNFMRRGDSLYRKNDVDKLQELSTDVSDFLFSHERLDDRERDRDFFIAARTLSRTLETPNNKRRLKAASTIKRMKEFLEARQERWKLRVSRVPQDKKPEQTDEILSQKPFQKAMGRIQKSDEGKNQNQALSELSKSISKYKNWIEDLEKAEDTHEEEMKKKKQQGISNARNKLKEIQKKQNEVSKALDLPSVGSHEEIADKWPITKIKQTGNASDTSSLEAQLRSLSPRAARRIKAAKEAMENTIESGEQEQFNQAETSADMASRLLRQADQAAQKSQRGQRQKKERRRRTNGDKYYGRSIEDLKVRYEYEVDEIYRDALIQQIDEMRDDQANKQLLENYMRKVIR